MRFWNQNALKTSNFLVAWMKMVWKTLENEFEIFHTESCRKKNNNCYFWNQMLILKIDEHTVLLDNPQKIWNQIWFLKLQSALQKEIESFLIENGQNSIIIFYFWNHVLILKWQVHIFVIISYIKNIKNDSQSWKNNIIFLKKKIKCWFLN